MVVVCIMGKYPYRQQFPSPPRLEFNHYEVCLCACVCNTTT